MFNKNPNQKYIDLSYFKPKRCPFCRSRLIIKWGFVYNHKTKKRRYFCKNCKNTFVFKDGFYRMRKSRELITECLNLYVNGLSTRKTKEHIEQFSEVRITHTSVLNWLRKYSVMLKLFTDKLPVNLGGMYHTDEIFIKCKGQENYFWNIVDKDTRFLVATHYSTERTYQSARMLFTKAKGRTNNIPHTIFIDGLQAYRRAYRRVFWNNFLKKRVYYVRITDNRDKRNNIIERVEGTLRERVKVMRGFGSPQSAEQIMNFICIWYNFIRKHQGIGMTPSQMAGIDLHLQKNKWLGLIYLSSGI